MVVMVSHGPKCKVGGDSRVSSALVFGLISVCNRFASSVRKPGKVLFVVVEVTDRVLRHRS